ncbi:MAG: DinB family protein [Chloroflexi bacterium]|nr:DinB family protein [Chloroflexota bacterium]
MDAREAFLAQHALIHAKSIAPDGMFSYEDRLFEDLSETQLRTSPHGLNSVVWTLWHISRYEDLVVNLRLRGEPEIFDNGWSDRLGVDHRQAGTGFGDDEVAALSECVNIVALREYRAAVGRMTRDWIAHIDLETLDHRPDVRGRITDAATLGVRAAWVTDFWEGKTVHELLLVPVLSHAFIHYGEVSVTRSRLGGTTR